MAKSPSLGNIKNLKAMLNVSASPKRIGNNQAHLNKNDAMNGPGTDHSFFPVSAGGPAKMSNSKMPNC
jgi:hypothetical protein